MHEALTDIFVQNLKINKFGFMLFFLFFFSFLLSVLSRLITTCYLDGVSDLARAVLQLSENL